MRPRRVAEPGERLCDVGREPPLRDRSAGVVAVTVHSWSYYKGAADRVGFVRDVVGKLRALPGVKAAGMTSSLPLQQTIGAEQAPVTIVISGHGWGHGVGMAQWGAFGYAQHGWNAKVRRPLPEACNVRSQEGAMSATG